MFAEYDFFHATVLLIGMALYPVVTLAFATQRICRLVSLRCSLPATACRAFRELSSSWLFSVSSFGQPELDRLSGRPKRHRGDLRHRPLRP